MKTIIAAVKLVQANYTILLFLGFTLIAGACDSFLDVELPKSQLTNKAVYENYQTAEAALVDIYSKIRDNGILAGNSAGLPYLLGNYADDLTCYGSASDPALNFYNNALLSSNTAVARLWNTAYNHIYAANAVIEGSEGSASLTSSNKKQLLGEALFIRALLHLYLTGIYGDIPYITTTDYQNNMKVQKLPQKDIYSLINKDLQSALLSLPASDLNTSRTRPGRAAVNALLARVYLYDNKWAEAANSASAVINETAKYNLETPSNVFLKDSNETIFQLQSSAAGRNTTEAISYIFLSAPPPLVSLSNNLINSFSAADLRKSNWTASVSNGSSVWYYAFKYKKNNNTAASVEYSIVLRLAEQYLIRAEARTQQGDFIGANEDLNRIRLRAGLPASSLLTKEAALQGILLERRLELFTEYGHRFFDLKRSGAINSVLSAVKPGWNDTDVLFPIPQTELGLNPNLLPQNSGY